MEAQARPPSPPPTLPVQLLFVLDTTERTGASWPLLQRACLAVHKAACNRHHVGAPSDCAQPLMMGVLLVRGRHSMLPLCTPSGFTTDTLTVKRWLRDVIFDGGCSSPALLEGLLAAAHGDWWHAGATRHVVLVTHGEPRPMPLSVGGASDDAGIWSPVPAELAAANITLSVVAPRRLPQLCALHAEVCRTAGMAVPVPTLYVEQPELLVASPLMPTGRRSPAALARPPSATAPAMEWRSSSPHPGVSLPSPIMPSPTGGEAHGGAVPSHPPHAKRRVVALSPPVTDGGRGSVGGGDGVGNGGGGSAGGSTSRSRVVWSGPLTVRLTAGEEQPLGHSMLLADREAPTLDHWLAASASWSGGLAISLCGGEKHPPTKPALLREITRDPLLLPVQLRVSQGKGTELFDNLRSLSLWAHLLLPARGAGAFIDAATKLEVSVDGVRGYEFHGWIVKIPDASAGGKRAPLPLTPTAPAVGTVTSAAVASISDCGMARETLSATEAGQASAKHEQASAKHEQASVKREQASTKREQASGRPEASKPPASAADAPAEHLVSGMPADASSGQISAPISASGLASETDAQGRAGSASVPRAAKRPIASTSAATSTARSEPLGRGRELPKGAPQLPPPSSQPQLPLHPSTRGGVAAAAASVAVAPSVREGRRSREQRERETSGSHKVARAAGGAALNAAVRSATFVAAAKPTQYPPSAAAGAAPAGGGSAVPSATASAAPATGVAASGVLAPGIAAAIAAMSDEQFEKMKANCRGAQLELMEGLRRKLSTQHQPPKK